jgi:hypothetical protein
MKQEVKKDCNFDFMEKLKTFYSRVPGDFRDVEKDADFVNELKQCQRQDVVNSLTALQNSHGKDAGMMAKTSYLLVKLDHDDKNNKKKLVSSYSLYTSDYPSNKNIENRKIFGPDYIIDMINDIILTHDPEREMLPDVFELEADGAMGTMMAGLFSNTFEENPEIFLRKLKAKSKKIRERTYFFLCFDSSGDKLVKNLDSIQASSDVYGSSREMLQFIKQNKACQEAGKDSSMP